MRSCLFILTLLVLGATSLSAQVKTVEALKIQVFDIISSLPGWCSSEKADRFINLVLEEKPKVCVEIGVFGGASAIPVALTLQYLGTGVLYAIDPWDKLECIKGFDPVMNAVHLEWWSRIGLHQVYLQYINTVKKYELTEQCITLRMTSEKAADKIGSIDILYIDGNHSECSTQRDVQLYLPKVRSGGYVWMNDATCSGTLKMLPALLQVCDWITSIDQGNCILLKKR